MSCCQPAPTRTRKHSPVPSLYILPSVPFASSRCRRYSRRTKPRPYRNNIYRYFGRSAQSPCNGSLPIDQFERAAMCACALSERSGNFLASQLCRAPGDVGCLSGVGRDGRMEPRGDGTIGAELSETSEAVRGCRPR